MLSCSLFCIFNENQWPNLFSYVDVSKHRFEVLDKSDAVSLVTPIWYCRENGSTSAKVVQVKIEEDGFTPFKDSLEINLKLNVISASIKMRIIFKRYVCERLARYKKLLELDAKDPILRGVSVVFYLRYKRSYW